MTLLYHEKQVAALCGVHCINTLLQGPYFSEIDLAQIAHQLDELERAVMAEGGGAEYQQFLNEASGNVAMDGMFSIQVLSKALEAWGLQVLSLEAEEARAFKAAPTSAEAFICNLQEHWFALRRVPSGDWWNFNSLFPAPQPLSTFYLQAFLDTLREEGWTIFVVAGKLPVPQPGSLEAAPNAPGKWWSPEEARAANEEAERARKRGRVANALESALERAGQQGGTLALRTRHQQQQARMQQEYGDEPLHDDDDADLAAAIAASLEAHGQAGGVGAGAAAGGGAGASGSVAAAAPAPALWQAGGGALYDSGGGGGGDDGGFEDDDPELAAAIAASLADAAGQGASEPGAMAAAEADAPAAPAPEPLEEEPAEGEGVIEIAFRLPNGSRCSRRFRQCSSASQLHAFLAQQLGPGAAAPGKLALSTQFPRQAVEPGPGALVSDLRLANRSMLLVEQRR